MSSSRNEIPPGGEESGVMLVPHESMNKLQRIPSFLRGSSNSNDDDYYDPKAISFGPYHHGKPELQLFQGFKHKVFDKFISGSSSNFYMKKMLEVVDEARRCYVEGSTDEFDDFKFGEMMLLDACFLLCYMMGGFDDFWLFDLIGASGYFFFIQLDMFLFENQIPLWIVELLFSSRFGSTIRGISWKSLLAKFCQTSLYGETPYRVDDDRDGRKPLYLLEAFHMHMVPCKSHTTIMLSPSTDDSAGVCCPNLFVIRFRTDEENSAIIKSQKDKFEKSGYIFRSVMDLKAKGIHFGHSDDIFSVTSIKFESSNYAYAKLKLPIWYASSLSRVFFSNMIAYEACPNHRTELEICSYITFMKSLIVCPNDVKELREKRIISNTLGDDMEVVQLFKALNPIGIDNPRIFSEVKQKIQEHYDSKANTWMAELVYTYLKSPWTIIALLAASLLLLLTLAQTYAAFNPRN